MFAYFEYKRVWGFFLSEGKEEYHVDFYMWLIPGNGEILGE